MGATETPIYDATVRDMAGKQARDYVRAAFNACPTCGATPGDLCVTRSGNPTGRHKARRWV